MERENSFQYRKTAQRQVHRRALNFAEGGRCVEPSVARGGFSVALKSLATEERAKLQEMDDAAIRKYEEEPEMVEKAAAAGKRYKAIKAFLRCICG